MHSVAPLTAAPQVKVYELSQLALKFERHLLSEARQRRVARSRYSMADWALVCASDNRLPDPDGGLL